MKAYEFKKYDEAGCSWNFEDELENNVLIWANSHEEAEEILQAMISSEYEDEVATYSAYEIQDVAEYENRNYCIFWN